MPDPTEAGLALLLRAARFAADRHRFQRRKDAAASPYINHPLAVAETLARVGGVTDAELLAAALLHDTLEDTRTTADELKQAFGAPVRALVEEVTQDKALPREARRRRVVERAPFLSREARQLKLADMTCNLQDVLDAPPVGWPDDRRRAYFDWAEAVAAGCRGVNPALDACFDDVLRRGSAVLPRS